VTTCDQTQGTPPNPQTVMTNDIGALERKGTYRFLSQLSTQKTKTISVNNRFKALDAIPEILFLGEPPQGGASGKGINGGGLIEKPPGLNLIDHVRPNREQGRVKADKKTWKQKRALELNCIERKCKERCAVTSDRPSVVSGALHQCGASGTVDRKSSDTDMFYQSDEDLQTEKERKQKEFKERCRESCVGGKPLQSGVSATGGTSKKLEEEECGICGGIDPKTTPPRYREISAVSKNVIEFTVDTGAEETVCNEDDGPEFPIVQGGQESETIYVMPDGRHVPNKGEKHLKVKTGEGGKFIVRTQVTSVRKPLMAVSKVCDEDNQVVFHKTGGYIEHLVTKERTHFKRLGNVYVLKLQLMDDEAGSPFTRQAH
jgi:hypothetical protein